MSPNFATENWPCPLCHSHESEVFIESQDYLNGFSSSFATRRCLACDLIFLNPRVQKRDVGAFYQTANYIPHAETLDFVDRLIKIGVDRSNRMKRSFVESYVNLKTTTGLTVADVGCGNGSFISSMAQAFPRHSFIGIDLFKNFESAYKNLKVEERDFDEVPLASGAYDILTLWHVFEHSYNPQKLIENCFQALKPGGYLIVEVPRLDSFTFQVHKKYWPGFLLPQHTLHFTKRSLIKFFSSSKFRQVEYFSYGSQPAYYYLFTGFAYRVSKNGFNLRKWIWLYMLGYILAFPLVWLEKWLNLGVQTLVLRKP